MLSQRLIVFLCLGIPFADVSTRAFQLRLPEARMRPRAAEAPATALRVDSSLVLIPAHVTNAAGTPVTGLRLGDFRLFEDGLEQTITNLAQDDAPVSVGVLIDASASMKGKMHKAAEAAADFFATSNPEDEFFLIQFGERPQLSVPFTTDPGQLYKAIRRIRPYGHTPLLDALHLARVQMKKAGHARKVLLILSDGGDNWSRHSARQVELALMESDVAVYAVGIFDPDHSAKRVAEEKAGPALLKRLAEQTGGHHFPVEKLADLPAITTRIGHEIRSQYVLGYYSTNKNADGKYRRIRVSVAATTEEPRFYLSYRRGYYATAE